MFYDKKAAEAAGHICVQAQSVTEEVLLDLLCNIPHVAITTAEEFDVYWGQAGYWLNQITDEHERSRWMLRFMFDLHQAWGVPMQRAAQCLQWAMSDAMGDDQ